MIHNLSGNFGCGQIGESGPGLGASRSVVAQIAYLQ